VRSLDLIGNFLLIWIVFLRALDYFSGILFLTTNRVGSFDEAFMSRIHVQIGYDPLDDTAREQIWDNFFSQLEIAHEEGGREIKCDWAAKGYINESSEVKSLQWNGREIRNGQFILIYPRWTTRLLTHDSVPNCGESCTG
jgi:hypothetical protein